MGERRHGLDDDLRRNVRITRLGQGVDKTGRLDPDASPCGRFRGPVGACGELARSHGADTLWPPIGTSALRDASRRSRSLRIGACGDRSRAARSRSSPESAKPVADFRRRRPRSGSAGFGDGDHERHRRRLGGGGRRRRGRDPLLDFPSARRGAADGARDAVGPVAAGGDRARPRRDYSAASSCFEPARGRRDLRGVRRDGGEPRRYGPRRSRAAGERRFDPRDRASGARPRRPASGARGAASRASGGALRGSSRTAPRSSSPGSFCSASFCGGRARIR